MPHTTNVLMRAGSVEVSINNDTSELVDMMRTVRRPDSYTQLSLNYLVDDGSPEGQMTTMEMAGEEAESLPRVIAMFNVFLAEAGFDAEVRVVPEYVKRGRAYVVSKGPDVEIANAA